ncbi:AAA family ATPase [Piscirickettsia salmonis]|uniref:AAA family ATPase n=1 Tax=Piscirickettsia salmonis TaxID=1238 RepID=UPI00137BE3C5|nr:AAA family ATPase [Piscirickettsia salmonis]QHS27497.1 AAA family ATPase [Piscirickettsia salmonis]
MLIKRLRVEEGFFNALDLEFSPGLNVLIGGRGVGKTSIIELLRFGLGAGNLSQSNNKESMMHALSILQSSGRVVIDIVENGVDMTISRSAFETAPVKQFTPPIIFSQKK